MPDDEMSGDIVIDDNAVRFSDRVGKYATSEQSCVLYRTAERLGKVAVDDRYPADPLFSGVLETMYPRHSSCLRNEFGVPHEHIMNDISSQLKKLGKT